MRKLSEIMKESRDNAPVDTTPDNDSSQSLIVFENVLDSEKVLHSSEIETLLEHFYGNANLSTAHTPLLEKLNTLIENIANKGLTSTDGRAMIYPVKDDFDNLVLEDHNLDYSGPLNILIVKPDEIERNLLVLTCHWGDNLFRNDHSVVGVIGETEDLEDLIDRF